MLQVFDRVLSTRSVETLVVMAVMALATLALMGVLEALRSRTLGALGVLIEQQQGERLLRHALAAAAQGTGETAAAARWVSWILGANPFDRCMLHGRGRNNPVYEEHYHNAPGGVCNGITSGFTDEADSANAAAARLRAEGAGAVVLLLHQGGYTGANQGQQGTPVAQGVTGAQQQVHDADLGRNC